MDGVCLLDIPILKLSPRLDRRSYTKRGFAKSDFDISRTQRRPLVEVSMIILKNIKQYKIHTNQRHLWIKKDNRTNNNNWNATVT